MLVIRSSLRVISGLIGIIGGIMFSAQPAQSAPTRPNFVILLCDDLGYGDLGCYGHPVIQTPNLDRLARDGVRFTDCYASAPVCSPSRAGLLTGRTPYRLGIYDWIPANSPMHVMKNERTIATVLKEAGYATCHVGKWHCNGKFNAPDQPQPGDHGFEHWFSTQNNAAPNHRNPTNFVRNGQRVGQTTGYSSTVIVDEAMNWLNRRKPEQPFFLFVCFHSPHEPVATAEEFVNPYKDHLPAEKAVYFGNVTQTDFEIGRLLKKLDDSKLCDDTFVFFTSDNGPEMLNRYRGAERSHGSPGPLRGMKLHLYEGGIRVPGILRWPGHSKPGQECRTPVINLDLLPTLCAASGVAVPVDRTLDGVNLVPLLGEKPLDRAKPLYWQYDKALGGPKVALRSGEWKILADDNLRDFELYNLRDDPREATNLAVKEPELRKKLSATLIELHRTIAAERPNWPTEKKPERGESD